MRTELSDGRVVLRRHHPRHALAVYQAARESIAEVGRWMPWCSDDFTLEASTAWLETQQEAWKEGTAHEFAIVDAESERLLGGGGVNQIRKDERLGNLGYWVRSSDCGRGIATAAARLLAGFAFDDLGLQRLEILVAVGNHASCRVADKIGALREGVLRKRVVIGNGQSVDAVMYSLVAGD